MLLIDDCRWNHKVEVNQLYSCPVEIEKISFSSEALSLADVSPSLHTNSWANHTINILRSQLIGNDVQGTVYREKDKLPLFRPYEPNDQGQLLAKTMAQCGMAYICPSFPGLSPIPMSKQEFFTGSPFVRSSFLNLSEPRKIRPPSMTHQPLLKMPSPSKLNGNSSHENKQTLRSSPLKETRDEGRYFAYEPVFGRSEKCIVTYVENGPWKFCIRSESRDDQWRSLNVKIDELVKTGSLVQTHHFDRAPFPVLCRSENDYYRGLVLGGTAQSIKVHFVDVGNEEDLAPGNVWSLPKELLTVPTLVVRCRLEKLPSSPNEQISKNFIEIVRNRNITVTFDKPTTDLLVNVHLEVNNMPIIELITNKVFSQQSVPNESKVLISHVNGNLIYLHQANAQHQLTQLQMKVQEDSATVGPLMDPLRGQPCLALYSEDQMWYRAQIFSLQDTVKVCYRKSILFTLWCNYARNICMRMGVLCHLQHDTNLNMLSNAKCLL